MAVLNICLDIKNARKKTKQEEQEKKEQRCLDQFFLTKTRPGSDNVNATPAAYTVILKMILK